MKNRRAKLMPGGIPRYIHVYDNGGSSKQGGSLDRYMVVFTGRYRHKTGGEFWHLSMNAAPFHPQGIGLHGGSKDQIDWPTYGHLGKRIKFSDLPEDCRTLVTRDYEYLWDIPLDGPCPDCTKPNTRFRDDEGGIVCRHCERTNEHDETVEAVAQG